MSRIDQKATFTKSLREGGGQINNNNNKKKKQVWVFKKKTRELIA